MRDLSQYMADNLRGLVAQAYRSVLNNPREARFALQLQSALAKGEKRRKKMLKEEGLEVPPFLIASIATTCNLHCAGCYARSNGIASDSEGRATLEPKQWKQIFEEAVALGFNVSLLAGGEPLSRHDLIEAIGEVKEMLFPVFTNGTLIGAQYIDFFRRHLNVIPVISLEGDEGATDERRGNGVYRRACQSMEMLGTERLYYGVSLTVTTTNMEKLTSTDYLKSLREGGCKIVFFVEYVPTTEGTEHLALSEEQNAWLEERVEALRDEVEGMIFVSFPGDEKALGGCTAAGRGFFHIAPDGSAEPCPFSPYSDTNVAQSGLKAALRSPLFSKLRQANALNWKHTGGCTLHEHRAEVEAMTKNEEEGI